MQAEDMRVPQQFQILKSITLRTALISHSRLRKRHTHLSSRREDGMRRQPAIALLFCIAPVICFAQQSSHKLSDYAGTWQAKFQGTTFMIINLVEKKWSPNWIGGLWRHSSRSEWRNQISRCPSSRLRIPDC